MAITVTGVAGSMEVAEWAQIAADMAPEVVKTGLKVTAAGGTRTVSVSAGRSYQAGSNGFLTSSQTTTFAANPSGQPRIDVVCLQVDFSAAPPTAETTAGTLVVVQGVAKANPVAPALTQVAGGIWQTPLANVTIASGATTLASSAVADVRPGFATGTVAVTVPGNFSADGTLPLTVRLAEGGIVEFGGRVTRTTTVVTVGDSAIGSVIIPSGFRPSRTVNIYCSSGLTGTPVMLLLVVDPDGTATLYPLTGTLAIGTSVRVQTTHWIGA